ncbi:DUF2244 domain-containing protein [Thioalkalivibrio sulfidiphilus]|uniref:DUF2244 domain-containing protein n=1 Tax=Thioalkalivibrio sulfidiphilus (strain HL-EbGR7) TaxID=396588 RepID=B8GPT5_THISH|nr:DUF2244 domain-containing protein [Thioalkalivibrio sulfidiphilus]ACL74082.1 conserved hypothetical protein [Thioalkalivibrio sulfidiphilus HL-EbGr7]
MRVVTPESEASERRFVIRPNRSLSLGGNLLFIAVVALALGIIAAVFVSAGYWVVAPFAGLELLVIILAVLSLYRRGLITEIIDITARAVTVSVVGRRFERSTRLPREDSRVVLRPPPWRGHPSRLFLAARDVWVEVGSCLREDERRGLASALRSAIYGPVVVR